MHNSPGDSTRCLKVAVWNNNISKHIRVLEIAIADLQMLLNIISLVSIPPFQLTKWPRRGWSSIFGVIPWLSPFQIVLTITFWSIRSSLGHMSTGNHARIPLVVADQKWSISKMLRHSLNISFGTEINPNHGISTIQIRTFTP